MNKPGLLSKERCLTFNRTLATAIGDRQSILLQQIQYWLDLNEKAKNPNHYRDGRWWTYNTYEDWHQSDFPFWSVRTIRRLISDLEKRGLVVSCQPYKSKGNQTKWYSIDYEVLSKLEAEILASPDVDKLDTHVANLDTHVAKMDNSHKDLEITPDNSSETTPYRTAFSLKSARSDFLDKEKEEIPKPKKPRLFDGTFGLSCDRNGWLKLPETLKTASRYREKIGLVKAQTLVWLKNYMVEWYSGELDVELDEWTDGSKTIGGKDFDEMPYSEFLGKDGPIPVQLMRDVINERTGGFQEEFNDKCNEFFWSAWHKLESKAA